MSETACGHTWGHSSETYIQGNKSRWAGEGVDVANIQYNWTGVALGVEPSITCGPSGRILSLPRKPQSAKRPAHRNLEDLYHHTSPAFSFFFFLFYQFPFITAPSWSGIPKAQVRGRYGPSNGPAMDIGHPYIPYQQATQDIAIIWNTL
ncbi:unnamed protein product [Nezara viridula]|uniref:Uncharacterized protein n=1 Tax=Nezara viridula TaxID=85310 RepID=A0A9P0EAH8_NEZVI|nr:unnamed protein product [Nezara viridula]